MGKTVGVRVGASVGVTVGLGVAFGLGVALGLEVAVGVSLATVVGVTVSIAASDDASSIGVDVDEGATKGIASSAGAGDTLGIADGVGNAAIAKNIEPVTGMLAAHAPASSAMTTMRSPRRAKDELEP